MKNMVLPVLMLLSFLQFSCGESTGNGQAAEESPVAKENFFVKVKEFTSDKLEVPAIDFSEEELKTTEGNYLIKGKLPNQEGNWLILNELTATSLIPIDSVKLGADGKFEFTGTQKDPILGFVTLNTTKPPGFPVVIHPEAKVKIEARWEDWISYRAKGDEWNEQMNRLYVMYTNHDKKLAEFNNMVNEIDPKEASDSLRKAIRVQFATLQGERTSDIQNFVKEEAAGPALYFAVRYLFQKPDIGLVETAHEKLKAADPEGEFTQELTTLIEGVKPLEVGSKAPELSFKDPNGKEVSLSSLRGKVVLIDFWASWCRPCRAENPHVVELYNKYKDKGFEIYGVSLDNNAAAWKKAIEKDGLEWIHVSDLRGWSSEAAQMYQVSSIPNTFLLDEKGRIIAKGLRANQLELKLAELLN